ncbi:flagellar basal body P-ring formation chaperone FlgA [Roseococcus suduntuyensis]|uniref:Flagella basal body P-ring formation protein FlgA n=1 Tax=Roseococcus suduntuyensis TaxID=455361 RepID=A0A840ADN4_9PROT|nr:flagellar basal body P-ring formation chaperone FlgA [Roseococcus suduntuyensis]MBB3899197.1 flagella basal body P-ring formation protein FlgA [Roseococcus suduntuyensis]
MSRRLFLAGLLAAPLAARAETPPALLRPHVLLEGDTLRVSDLFDQAGPRGATPLAAAPLPGRRMVLEAQNLWNIARAHGVPWRPLTGQERAVVERPGRPVPRAEIEALLRAELTRHGMDEEMEMDLPGLIPPMIPGAAFYEMALEGVVLEQPSLRFAATLLVLADGMPAQRMRLVGRAAPTTPVVVATRRLALNEIIAPEDARLIRLRAERVRPGQAQQLEQVVGQELRRPMAVEQSFALVDLGPPSIVQRNALVTLLLDTPGLQLAVQGRAMRAAARGEAVTVMNLTSRSVVEGIAIAPGRVRVAMGSVPVSSTPLSATR